MPPRMVAVILIPIRVCGAPSSPPKPRTCPPKHQAGHSAWNWRVPGATYEEFSLEGYGPGGVAVLLDINTDNRNRTVSEIRHAFGKNGGNMAEAGAVSWMFHKKGDIIIPKSGAKEDDLMNIVLEAGGEDLNDDGENWEILTEPSAYETVLEAVKKAGIEPASASVSMIPQTYIKLEGQAANTMIRLWRLWRSTTTCRTCTPTSISTRSCWKKWLDNCRRDKIESRRQRRLFCWKENDRKSFQHNRGKFCGKAGQYSCK